MSDKKDNEGIGDRLRDAIHQRKLKSTHVAKACGISPSTFDGYFKTAMPSADKALRIAEYLDVDVQWLITGVSKDAHSAVNNYMKAAAQKPRKGITIDLIQDVVRVPRISVELSAGSGRLQDRFEVIENVPFNAEVLARLGHISDLNVAIFNVRGDSMEPTCSDGSMALVDLKDTQIVPGIFAIAVDGEARIKRLSKRITGELDIISDNDFYKVETLAGDDLNLVKIIGRVRWFGNWV